MDVSQMLFDRSIDLVAHCNAVEMASKQPAGLKRALDGLDAILKVLSSAIVMTDASISMLQSFLPSPHHITTNDQMLRDSSDYNRFTQLPARLRGLQDLTTSFKHQFTPACTDLIPHYTPIESMPPETMRNIFHHLASHFVGQNKWGRYRTITSIGAVSKRWRAICLDQASLWCTIDLELPVTVIEEWIQRSAELPLTAIVDLTVFANRISYNKRTQEPSLDVFNTWFLSGSDTWKRIQTFDIFASNRARSIYCT